MAVSRAPHIDALTTFKCDGCGQRFPAEQIWERTARMHQALTTGNGTEQCYVRGKRTYVVIRVCCSEACYQAAPVRTVMGWCRWFVGDSREGVRLYYRLVHNVATPMLEASALK